MAVEDRKELASGDDLLGDEDVAERQVGLRLALHAQRLLHLGVGREPFGDEQVAEPQNHHMTARGAVTDHHGAAVEGDQARGLAFGTGCRNHWAWRRATAMPQRVGAKRLKNHDHAFRNGSRERRRLIGLRPLVGFAPSRGYHRDHMSDVRRRQGWVVVGACSLVMFGVWNSHAGFGVFLPVLASEFGWSRGAISVSPSLNLSIGGLISFWIA